MILRLLWYIVHSYCAQLKNFFLRPPSCQSRQKFYHGTVPGFLVIMYHVPCWFVFVFVLILLVHDLAERFAESAVPALESCTEKEDCRKRLLCVDIDAKLCEGQKHLIACRCSPVSRCDVKFCSETDLECPHGERCAKSKLSSSKMCVACSLIEASDTSYPPLHPSLCNSASGNSATPSPSPHLVRHSYDLCDMCNSCRSDLSCKSSESPIIDCDTSLQKALHPKSRTKVVLILRIVSMTKKPAVATLSVIVYIVCHTTNIFRTLLSSYTVSVIKKNAQISKRWLFRFTRHYPIRYLSTIAQIMRSGRNC